MDPRLSRAPVVTHFADAVHGFVAGLYVAGSVASGDYRPGVSDIDAVALVDRAPRPALRRVLVETHERLIRTVEGADGLHCVYVARPAVEDLSYRHWTWAFGELLRRPLGGIARAELLAEPVVVVGPPPSAWLAPLSESALRDAARAELAGYWTTALRKRSIWLEDVYVDVGLTTLARADATIRGVVWSPSPRRSVVSQALASLPGWSTRSRGAGRATRSCGPRPSDVTVRSSSVP